MTKMEYIGGQEEKVNKVIENWNWGLCFGKSVLGSMTSIEYIGGEEEKVNKVIEN